MSMYKYTYKTNSNVLKLKKELISDSYFSAKISKVVKEKNSDGDDVTIISTNINIGVNESMLRAIVFNHNPVDQLELEEEFLRMRIEYGEIVVERFRLMSIASRVSGADSLALFNLLGSLASMLRLGLLSDTAYVLSVMQGVPLLDMPCILEPTKTVRNYFIELCLKGNDTTEELS